MPDTCVICRNPHRESIDTMLLTGVSYRTIKAKFGTSLKSLSSHKQRGHHLEPVTSESKPEQSDEGPWAWVDFRTLHAFVHAGADVAQEMFDAETYRTFCLTYAEKVKPLQENLDDSMIEALYDAMPQFSAADCEAKAQQGQHLVMRRNNGALDASWEQLRGQLPTHGEGLRAETQEQKEQETEAQPVPIE